MANQVPAADIVTNASDAIVAGPGDIIIINSDILISAQGNGFEAIIGTSGAHIEILGQVESTNSNAISLTTNSQISIEVGGSVFSTGSGVLVTDNNNVINHGSITAFHGVNFASTSGINELVNTGTITGFSDSITGGAGTELIVNHGTLVGSVFLGGGIDSFDGRGGQVVFGFVDLGDGNDLGQGGDFADSFSGGNGNDSILGNGGNDSFNASSTADGDDTFDGGDGIDAYFALNATAAVAIDLDEGSATGASIGNDKLVNVEDASGSGFDDFLSGNDLVNTLHGLGGVDTLFGAGGRDSLFGEDGNDILRGGAGGDFLTGGNDSDTFDYNSLADSGITASTRDQILDFVHAADEIDLSTLDANKLLKGNQAFKFVGGGFTKAGQVYAVAHGNDTLVEINIDKDKAPEMSILLHGAITLNAGDFIL